MPLACMIDMQGVISNVDLHFANRICSRGRHGIHLLFSACEISRNDFS
jgi:hypothetical protein